MRLDLENCGPQVGFSLWRGHWGTNEISDDELAYVSCCRFQNEWEHGLC